MLNKHLLKYVDIGLHNLVADLHNIMDGLFVLVTIIKETQNW